MGAASPMRSLVRWRRLRIYWADRDVFLKPGVHVWIGPRFGHLRILPAPCKRRRRR